MRIRSLGRPAALLVAGALLATACSSDDTDPVDDPSEEMTDDATDAPTDEMTDGAMGEFTTITDGALTVCSDIPYAPFEFEEEGTATGYSGFDVEIMEGIAASMDLELVISVTGFDAIQSGTALAANACDVAASAMTITPEREENVDFTDPYFDADQSLLVKGDSGIVDLATLEGALGVQADTTGQDYAEANFDGDIIEFPGAAELFAALEAGTVVGILQDLPVNVDRAQQDASVSVVATFTTGEQYGFAVAEGNTALLAAINAGLAEMRADGSYDAIYASYFEA